MLIRVLFGAVLLMLAACSHQQRIDQLEGDLTQCATDLSSESAALQQALIRADQCNSSLQSAQQASAHTNALLAECRKPVDIPPPQPGVKIITPPAILLQPIPSEASYPSEHERLEAALLQLRRWQAWGEVIRGSAKHPP